MYNYLWFFLIYSFGGWIAEVMFHAVRMGKVINRGFLLGPVCPIYGFGLVFIVKVYGLFEFGLIGSFAIGIVLATLIELIGGYLLYELFGARWWDYSDKKFQLGGFICLEFSLIWGFAATFIVKLVHPAVVSFVERFLSGMVGWGFAVILSLIYVADLVITVITVNRFNADLRALNDLANGIKHVSDNLSEVIGGNTLQGAQYIDEQRVKAALFKAEVRDDMSEAYNDAVKKMCNLKNKMMKRRFLGEYRLLRAFPSMQHRKYKFALKEIMDNMWRET
ncbi:MAG: putative ABC transporter permease [Lachnospiraceae bacterium]|nr:putative ABC transporter permease [Lachnospiraceae bacterium]